MAYTPQAIKNELLLFRTQAAQRRQSRHCLGDHGLGSGRDRVRPGTQIQRTAVDSPGICHIDRAGGAVRTDICVGLRCFAVATLGRIRTSIAVPG